MLSQNTASIEESLLLDLTYNDVKELITTDFNKDNLTDVIVNFDNELYVYHNEGNWNFEASYFYSQIEFLWNNGKFIDFNNDGLKDIIAYSIDWISPNFYPPYLNFYKNDGTGAYQLEKSILDDDDILDANRISVLNWQIFLQGKIIKHT